MSEETAALVRALQPSPDLDLARAFRDERAYAAVLKPTLGGRLHPDAECVIVMPGDDPRNPRNLHRGLHGFRDACLEWIAPWESYHVVEIEDIIDLGDSALVLVRDRGRMRGMSGDVDLRGAAIWTVREGLVIRAEFYADREQAFDVAGLSHAGDRGRDETS
jgi:ketosteroid isomerase-like protein